MMPATNHGVVIDRRSYTCVKDYMCVCVGDWTELQIFFYKSIQREKGNSNWKIKRSLRGDARLQGNCFVQYVTYKHFTFSDFGNQL